MKEIIIKEKIPIYEEKEKIYFRCIDGSMFDTSDEAIKHEEEYKERQKKLAKFQLRYGPPLHIIEKIENGYENLQKEFEKTKHFPYGKIFQLMEYHNAIFRCRISGMNEEEIKQFIKENAKK